jgi:hypothetical protein
MNLSSDTVAVLKNFSDINQNILVKPGNKVQTISTMKNILAEAEVKEQFDSEFAIYDLPEFLRSIDLFSKPSLELNGGSYVKIAEGQSDKTFNAYFKVENFKMISDDYDVAISSQKISHFINRHKKVQYWIALEPDSEF